MPLFSVRLLQERKLAASIINPNVDFQLYMEQTTIHSILPSLSQGGSLELSYNINSPEFVSSILGTRNYYYHFFGWAIIVCLFVFFLIVGVIIAPERRDKGQIIAHILFLKTAALMIYPSRPELIDYCSGFMVADLPWLNSFFG